MIDYCITIDNQLLNNLVGAGKGGARIVALIRAEEAVDGFYQVSCPLRF